MKVIGRIPQKMIEKFWDAKQSDYIEITDEFLREGYSALQLIQQLNEEI